MWEIDAIYKVYLAIYVLLIVLGGKVGISLTCSLTEI